MRIISGKYRGFKLFTLSGNSTRPTMESMKESIFSVLFDIDDFIVLDLYAGSGSLGFEAISRGASFVDFVDASDKAMKILLKNMEKLKLKESVRIHRKKAIPFVKKIEKKYDLIFMDPPYDKNLVNKTLKSVIESDILSNNGVIVVEHFVKEKIDCLEGFENFYERGIGMAKVSMFRRRENENI